MDSTLLRMGGGARSHPAPGPQACSWSPVAAGVTGTTSTGWASTWTARPQLRDRAGRPGRTPTELADRLADDTEPATGCVCFETRRLRGADDPRGRGHPDGRLQLHSRGARGRDPADPRATSRAPPGAGDPRDPAGGDGRGRRRGRRGVARRAGLAARPAPRPSPGCSRVAGIRLDGAERAAAAIRELSRDRPRPSRLGRGPRSPRPALPVPSSAAWRAG